MKKFLKSCFAFVLGIRHVVQNGFVNLLLGKGAGAAMCFPSPSFASTKAPVVQDTMQETSTTAQAFQSEHPAEDHQAAGGARKPAKLHILYIR